VQVEVGSDMELGVGEPEIRHARGADRHPVLARVLQKDDRVRLSIGVRCAQ
jgi:hypothetical protein